ncbi:MAG: sporulation transcription factor Spo0A [Oscillospiraceae bacterium]|jgi:two-component system response regulator (stage 0 sporulation protein A)|nr:sporulation transcription factor Spo0A [Oscillospiraceae bacterium]
MEQVKLMIVEDNADLRRMLGDYFHLKDDVVVVGTAANGADALRMIEETPPDVMLLDMIMPQMDGFELLIQLRQKRQDERPEVIALTALNRDDFISRAIELGARYYMVKPFDFDVLHQRVIETAGKRRSIPEIGVTVPGNRSKSVDERIATMFLTIGMPAHIKGYQFLREAVKMVMDTPDMINRITKELYPGIAHKFGTTSSKVERAIRHAIEVAWGRGRIDVINQVFGSNVCTLENKPTNGEFIALVADKLSLERAALA